jgi:CrcB protein
MSDPSETTLISMEEPSNELSNEPSNEPSKDLETASSPKDVQNYHSVPESGNAEGVGLKNEMVPLEQDLVPTATKPMTSFLDAGHRKTLVQACYLGVGAIFGTLLRMVLAQKFGEGCKNPGTIGWLAASEPLCVTASGETSQQGDIIFADLPANLLGCFIMGLMQDGKALDLAVHAPIAWLSPRNAFQGWDVFHLAIKTGFCGSLTTFSSWNSEMVVMLVGEGATQMQSQVWKALFGYIIGLETALGSFVFGRTVACWLHRWRNPVLREEAYAIKVREVQGVYINHALPEFERRFLPDLPMSTGVNDVEFPALPCLERWRDSTKEARRIDTGPLESLNQIENSVFVENEPITQEMEDNARKRSWDIDALKEYVSMRAVQLQTPPTFSPAGVRREASEDTFLWYKLPYAASLLGLIFVMLAVLLVTQDAETAVDITNRTMVYVLFFSTPGVLLRWKLGGLLNGKLRVDRLSWLPAGTLSANVMGAIVSICMIATEYNLSAYGGFWTIGTLRAIKIGFCGCLTTVSTFIAEVHGMTKVKQDRAYKYILITLSTSALLSMVLFSIIVYV